MKEFKKTKPLSYVLKELPIGETIMIPNSQARSTSVRQTVTNLRREGYKFKASCKGMVNKIAVTKLSNKE